MVEVSASGPPHVLIQASYGLMTISLKGAVLRKKEAHKAMCYNSTEGNKRRY